jgi:hypothetical protein
MSDASTSHRRQYSDSQTVISKMAVFGGWGVREIASESRRVSDVQSYGGSIREITRADVCVNIDGKRSYSFALRLTAIIGASAILIGFVIGVISPSAITAAILTIGLVLFSLAGFLARRQEKVPN